jgi:hypothetical protein
VDEAVFVGMAEETYPDVALDTVESSLVGVYEGVEYSPARYGVGGTYFGVLDKNFRFNGDICQDSTLLRRPRL